LFGRTTEILETDVPQTRIHGHYQIPRKGSAGAYRNYNESKHIVTWNNGAETRFGSMHHEHNAWDFQGQWLRIDYDELTEFTITQWQATSAWNRCPASPFTRKGGATNPIGPGADWVEHLFVIKKPCERDVQAAG
jgi:hypothetical protein